MLLAAGLVVGCWNAWRWVTLEQREIELEQREIDEEQRESGEESRDVSGNRADR